MFVYILLDQLKYEKITKLYLNKVLFSLQISFQRMYVQKCLIIFVILKNVCKNYSLKALEHLLVDIRK